MTDFEDVVPAIPTTTWCLVDTNESLETIPAPISNTPFFILQAASPERKHLQWANKTIGILQYVMKPFSLSELIIGYENSIPSFTSLSDFDVVRRNRSLDVSKSPSEKSLQEYYRQYTPSARFAYQHAGNLDKYTNFVRSLFGQLTVNRMEKLVGAFLSTSTLLANKSYTIFLPSQSKLEASEASLKSRSLVIISANS